MPSARRVRRRPDHTRDRARGGGVQPRTLPRRVTPEPPTALQRQREPSVRLCVGAGRKDETRRPGGGPHLAPIRHNASSRSSVLNRLGRPSRSLARYTHLNPWRLERSASMIASVAFGRVRVGRARRDGADEHRKRSPASVVRFGTRSHGKRARSLRGPARRMRSQRGAAHRRPLATGRTAQRTRARRARIRSSRPRHGCAPRRARCGRSAAPPPPPRRPQRGRPGRRCPSRP